MPTEQALLDVIISGSDQSSLDPLLPLDSRLYNNPKPDFDPKQYDFYALLLVNSQI